MTTKIAATLQCRMTSHRLPGKILLPAAGKPLLAHMIERLRRVPSLDEIIIATTTNNEDDPVADFATREGLGLFRGSEDDVLGRIVGAAQKYEADVLVHLTSDCPLIDPMVVEESIRDYLRGDADFVSNCLSRTYPRGMDTQVFARTLLEETARIATDPAHREHVTLYIVENPQEFRHRNVPAPRGYQAPDLRMTLDYPEDYALIRHVFEALYPTKPDFILLDVLNYLEANPDVANLTAQLAQKEVRPSKEIACP